MKVLRKVVGFTLWDWQISESIRDACGMQDVAEWTGWRKKMWSEHVDQIDEEKLAKICMAGQPLKKIKITPFGEEYLEDCLKDEHTAGSLLLRIIEYLILFFIDLQNSLFSMSFGFFNIYYMF